MTHLWLTILCTLFTGKVIGHQHKAHASHQKNHRRQHQAHVHGQGELQMVFDAKKNEIAIKLTAPMEDIAGFEHEPKTHAQLKILQDQTQKIKNANVAVFDEASNCNRKSLEVSFPVELSIKETGKPSSKNHNKESHKHEHKESHKQEHKEPHKHEHKEPHKHEHKEPHKQEHSDVVVDVVYQCKKPEKLSYVKLDWFESMRKPSVIKASYIGFPTKRGHGVQELTAKGRIINL